MVWKSGVVRTVCLRFAKQGIDLHRVKPGYKLWKTSDPELEKALRQSYSGEQPQVQQPIDIDVHGVEGESLVAIATDPQGHIARATSEKLLEVARNRPLTAEKLVQQLSRLGNTPFKLGALTNNLADGLILPVSELNRLRRELVAQLLTQRQQPKVWRLEEGRTHGDLLPLLGDNPEGGHYTMGGGQCPPSVVPLVRDLGQLRAVLEANLLRIYCELENPVHYRDAVALTCELNPKAKLYVAPPRITKPGEQ